MEDALPSRESVADPDLRRAIDEGRTVMESPKWLFLAHDVTCNLACPSCRSELLGADEAQERRFDVVERQVLRPLLNSKGEVLISVSGQGDPWSSHHYRSILRYMADHQLECRLNIHTNALLMSEKKWEEYKGLEQYETVVDVSIDACTPHVYEVVRRPGKFARLDENLRFIARKRAAGIFREFHLNATIQLDNFHEMPTLVDYAEALGADSMRLYMIQNTGSHIAGSYKRGNVADAEHPLHLAFLETLRDARLAGARAHLYDVAIWRDRALAATLPSDALGEDAEGADFGRAIADAQTRGEYGRVVALTVAARRRTKGARYWLRIEADALAALGFVRQAEYRRRDAEAIDLAEERAAA